MTVQLAVSIRTAELNALITDIGASPVVKIRTGAPPANVATADSGTVVASITLGATWATVTNGVLTFSDVPLEDLSADSDGTAAHYRVYASDGTTAKMQGTVTVTGGGGDMTVDNDDFAAGQEFAITAWTMTAGNA